MEKPGFWQSLKQKARNLKQNLFVLYLAYKDSQTPVLAKLFAACVVAYAFSPVDLIPDFIPVLGYLDDVILVPIGIAIALRMIPAQVLERCRLQAKEMALRGKPRNWIAGALIIAVWLLCAAWLGKIVWERIVGN